MRRKKPSTKEILDQYWPAAPKHEVEEARERIWKRLKGELEKHDTSLRSLYGDGWSAEPLDQREFQVLTAASVLGDRATLATITKMVEDWMTGGEMVGPVYATLSRLADRELIKVHAERETSFSEPRHRFEVTEEGSRALRRARMEGKELVTVQEKDVKNGCTERPGFFK